MATEHTVWMPERANGANGTAWPVEPGTEPRGEHPDQVQPRRQPGDAGGGSPHGPRRRREPPWKDFEVGGKDESGRDITWIHWRTDDYFVYQWERRLPAERFWRRPSVVRGTSAVFRRREQRLRYADIGCNLSRVHAMQDGRLAHRESVNREIARAVAMALEGRRKEAKEILGHLHDRLVNLRNAEGQASYLSACMLFMAPLLAAVGLLEIFRPPALLEVFGEGLLLPKVVACGGLGALLSVCLHIKEFEVDPETPHKVNWVSGLVRPLIGVAAGLISYLAIASGLVFSFMEPDGGDPGGQYLLLLVAVGAGFSEGYVPNILRRVRGEGAGSGEPDTSGGSGSG